MRLSPSSQLATSDSPAPQTLREVYDHFTSDPSFGRLSIGSQTSYRYLAQYISIGLRLSALSHATIEKALNPLKDRPGLYRRARSGILRLGAYAVENGWLPSAPTHIRDKAVKLGAITRWTRNDVLLILDEAKDSDPELAVAIALMYYTAQRLIDCRRLRPCDIIEILHHQSETREAGVCRRHFRIIQSKTGEEVFPEITSDLEKWLPSDLSSGECYLKSPENALRERFLERCPSMAKAGKTLHGLRKAASCEVAEGGGTLPELMALLGHRSPATAAIYFKQANQAMLASSAAGKRGKISG